MLCVYASHTKPQPENSSHQIEGPHNPQSPVSLPDTVFGDAGNPISTNSTSEESTSTAQPIYAGERDRLNGAPLDMALPSNHTTPLLPYFGLDFSNLDLFCPIDVDGITTRWMNPYIPVPGQKIKQYPPGVNVYIYRVLKSYATIAARGRGIPPFIHPSQLSISGPSTASPLTTCLSLIRICANPIPGSEASVMVVIQREMEAIMQWHTEYDDVSLLAAFQAYLIYCLIMFFKLNQAPDNQLRPAMINLQTIAHLSCKKGLMCVADQHHARPRWEEWIVAETKRRSLYVVYLFDSVLSTQEDVPTFLGTELTGLPSTASKSLWEAESRGIWEKEYNVHLAEWTERGLTIDELWPIPEDMDEMSVEERRRRVDHWLEDIDEFGTMMYAVTACTHGG